MGCVGSPTLTGYRCCYLNHPMYVGTKEVFAPIIEPCRCVSPSEINIAVVGKDGKVKEIVVGRLFLGLGLPDGQLVPCFMQY